MNHRKPITWLAVLAAAFLGWLTLALYGKLLRVEEHLGALRGDMQEIHRELRDVRERLRSIDHDAMRLLLPPVRPWRIEASLLLDRDAASEAVLRVSMD